MPGEMPGDLTFTCWVPGLLWFYAQGVLSSQWIFVLIVLHLCFQCRGSVSCISACFPLNALFSCLGCSNFSDVFDVEYFIKALANDIPVIKALPPSMKSEPKVLKQFRSWSGVKYYEQEIGRLWLNYKVHPLLRSLAHVDFVYFSTKWNPPCHSRVLKEIVSLGQWWCEFNFFGLTLHLKNVSTGDKSCENRFAPCK